MRKTTSLLVTFLLVPALLFFQVTSEAQNVFNNCPPKGSATARTKDDPELNKLKNRIEVPKSFEEMSFDALVNLPVPKGVSRQHRAYWPSKDLAQVQAQEKRAVRVEGYIVATNQAHMESCNCYIGSDLDFHIWLAGLPDGSKSQAVVTEATPRVRINHPGWTLEALNKLVENHTKVRINGWIMLDPDCPGCVGRTRGTLWEIHPVLKIEVQDLEGWREFEDTSVG